MTDIQRLMLSMFFHLRLGVGFVGLSLPLVLVFWGDKVEHVGFAGSMSAYYHATPKCSLPQCDKNGNLLSKECLGAEDGRGPMRNWFVGNLFFIGAAMFLMKGFSFWEDWALNFAGIAAPCVALIPMSWPCPTKGLSIHSFHFPSAMAFFICAGFTCVFCSEKTLREAQKQGKDSKVIRLFRSAYIFLGIAMVALPALAWIFAYHSGHKGFYLEMSGVVAFGAYWLVKTYELHWSQIEVKALTGQLPAMNPKSLF